MRRIWRKLVLALIYGSYSLAAYATPLAIEADGTVSIASGAHRVFLDNNGGVLAYHHVMVWTSTGASTIYLTLNPGATASTNNAQLIGGAGLAYGLNSPPAAATNQLNYDGTGTTGVISWMAW
jgi:hypothetical protein